MKVDLVLGRPGDASFCELRRAGGLPTFGGLDRRRLDALEGSLLDKLWPPEGLELPGSGALADRRERAVAAELLAALMEPQSLRAVADELHACAGLALGTDEVLVLCLDLRDDVLRRLPWELLEVLPPSRSLPQLRVLRVQVDRSGPAGLRWRGTRLDVLHWSPGERDPTVDQVDRALWGLLQDSTLVRLRELDPGLGAPWGDDAPAGVRVLHVVSHGLREADSVVLQLADARLAGPENMARWLEPVLDGVDVVLLDVCGAASGSVASADAPAPRLAAAGVPAVIAPRLSASPEAAVAFAGGFYRALQAGDPLLDAVAAGRRAVVALGRSHPTARWWNMALYVSDAEGAERHARLRRARLPGWQAGSPEAERVIGLAVYEARQWGFLGVEQLALAVAGSASGQLAVLLFPHTAALQRIYFLLRVQPDQLPPEPRVTSRLAELGAGLEEGYGLVDLMLALLATPDLQICFGVDVAASLRNQLVSGATTVGPDLPMSTEDHSTGGEPAPLLMPSAPRRHLGAELLAAGRRSDEAAGALILEVIGGPESGRRIALDCPAVLGRSVGPDSPPDALYAGLAASSRLVSRQHAELSADGHLRAMRSVYVQRGAEIIEVPAGEDAPDPVGPGDLLHLDVKRSGAGAHLLVVALPEIDQ